MISIKQAISKYNGKITKCNLKKLKDVLIAAENENCTDFIHSKLNGEDVPVVIEFPGMDIELTLYGLNKSGKVEANFVTCYQDKKHGWHTHDFADLSFNKSMLDNEDKLLDAMFNGMITMANETNLKWAEIN